MQRRCVFMIAFCLLFCFVSFGCGHDTRSPDDTADETPEQPSEKPENPDPTPTTPGDGTGDHDVPPAWTTVAQTLNYSESTETLFNPEQGFYRPIRFTVTPDGIAVSGSENAESFASNWQIRNYENYLKYVDQPWSSNKYQSEYTKLYHMRVDISALSKRVNGEADLEINDKILADLDHILKAFLDKDLNVIIRFCYAPNFGSDANMEPPLDVMQKHVERLSSVLTKYDDTITAIEVGLIGPWGEMHTSDMAKDGVTIPQLMHAFLEHTAETKIPVLVRTPRHLYQYIFMYEQGHETAAYNLSLADIQNATIPNDHEGYRLGMFNDGYLGSSSDTGTYKARSEEVNWLRSVTDHTPYGGEVINPSDNARYHLDYAEDFDTLEEMYALNLSYLNIEWNYDIVEYWVKTPYEGAKDRDLYAEKTDFEFVKNHLGYRLVLRGSEFSLNAAQDAFKCVLTIENTGFGQLNRSKKASLIFKDKASGEVTTLRDVAEYQNEDRLVMETPITLGKGSYDVFVRLDNGDGHYAVTLANDGLWDDALKANRVGELTI